MISFNKSARRDDKDETDSDISHTDKNIADKYVVDRIAEHDFDETEASYCVRYYG